VHICDAGPCTWVEAGDYCTALGARLPEIKELISLVDYSVALEPLFPEGHPFAFIGIGEEWWSATTQAAFVGNAWFLEQRGRVATHSKSEDQDTEAWCVR
jgi:hypothetical protein